LVVALQKALNNKGAKPKLQEDGMFGTGTTAALKAFQKKNKLTADGIAGPQTFKALGIKIS
jgi:peptidoglycan hydrolase-like protein with peptidoglycan-binding domain